jgi:hypothetical protein
MKQVAMYSALDNDVGRPTTPQQYPMTDLVRTNLQQTGSKFTRLGAAVRREQPAARSRAQDLWDYLGDFA